MKNGFFITGTDTEVGKTFVTCCLLKTLQSQTDLPIYPRKPIASGAIRFTAQKLISQDAMLLKTHSLTNESLNTICPYLFEESISPARAIKINQQKITLSDLVKACDTPNDGIKLVEGAGGFYSPLTGESLNSDLAIKLKLPIIIVTENRTGCINQILMAIEAVKANNLKIACVVINDTHLKSDIENVKDIIELTDTKCIHIGYQPQQTPIHNQELWQAIATYLTA